MRLGLLPLSVVVLGALAATPPALAQFDANLVPGYTIWDIRFGEPISQIPAAEIAEIACGTNGGPPSTPLGSFAEFEKCPAEPSGLHEVYFTNDDEADYIAKALETEYRVMQGGNSSTYPGSRKQMDQVNNAGVVQRSIVLPAPGAWGHWLTTVP